MAGRKDIRFKSPVTLDHWRNYLTESKSPIAQREPEEYRKVIDSQAAVSQGVFVKPISVICGAAGTGKTTVIKAIIRAIEKAHGVGTSFILLAPTGKATDRIREATGKPASTIHAFLASLGWLNKNLTFKQDGGQCDASTQTVIIDEASMLDLQLAATLLRAIDWNGVQRLILVGDPNQLPPIGRGKVFAEIIDWLTKEQPTSLATLEINIRQMDNRLSGRGRRILDLAELYLRADVRNQDDEGLKSKSEEILKQVQEGGEVDQDLRVVYWNGADDLERTLIDTIVSDMERDTGTKLNPERPYELWRAAEAEFADGNRRQRSDYLQVLSPYRGETYGTDNLNALIQRHVQRLDSYEQGEWGQRMLDGIMHFDKVIQCVNRTKSKPLYAYNTDTRATERVEVFNGELGFVKPHGFDGKKWHWPQFRVSRFQVVFSRKEHLWVGYGSRLGRTDKGKWLKAEKVEDNLELAYAISVHKAQGSEFDRVYLIVPKSKTALLSPELFYTGLTRARRHCTLLIEEDISPLLEMRRRECSHLLRINSSVFYFQPLAEEVLKPHGWYKEGRVHKTLAECMVRSKSEVIIANMLCERDIPFKYEVALFAPDGTFYLPDFTVTWNGEQWYWEHWGMMSDHRYRVHTEEKRAWYQKHYPGKLVETFESPNLSKEADQVIRDRFS